MEDEWRLKIDKILLGVFVFTICLLASAVSYDTSGWWFPLVSGSVGIIGFYREIKIAVDVSILASASSFFYFVRYISLNPANLIFILTMFILYFGAWSFMRRASLIGEIEKDMQGDGETDLLQEYKRHSAHYHLWSLFWGFVVASLGGVVAIYSFVGPFSPDLATFIILLFGAVVFTAVYGVVVFLPKYFARKKIG